MRDEWETDEHDALHPGPTHHSSLITHHSLYFPNTFPPARLRRSTTAFAGPVPSGTASGRYFSSPFSRVILIVNRFLLKNAVTSPTGVLIICLSTCDQTV